MKAKRMRKVSDRFYIGPVAKIPKKTKAIEIGVHENAYWIECSINDAWVKGDIEKQPCPDTNIGNDGKYLLFSSDQQQLKDIMSCELVDNRNHFLHAKVSATSRDGSYVLVLYGRGPEQDVMDRLNKEWTLPVRWKSNIDTIKGVYSDAHVEKRVKPLKLEIDLVPKSLFKMNLKQLMPQAEWDVIRMKAYDEHGRTCAICGADGNFSHGIECHEIWERDDEKHIQKLTGFQALCPKCHQIKHYGRSEMVFNEEQMEALNEHFIKVNEVGASVLAAHRSRSFMIFSERNKHQWTVDFNGYLKPDDINSAYPSAQAIPQKVTA